MKSNIIFGIILVLGSSFWGCNSDQLFPNYEEEMQLVTSHINKEVSGLKSVGISALNMIALMHKDRKVGSMIVENNNAEIVIRFDCDPNDYSINLVQLWVGINKSKIPSNVNGIPVPGKFPYKDSGSKNFTFNINEEEIGEGLTLENLSEIILVAHVELTNLKTGKKESAWSDGELISDNGNATYSAFKLAGGCYPYVAYCGSEENGEYYFEGTEDDQLIQAKTGENTWQEIGLLYFDSGKFIFSFDKDWMLTDLLTPTVIITGYDVPGSNGQEIYAGPPLDFNESTNYNFYYGPVDGYNYYTVELKVQYCY